MSEDVSVDVIQKTQKSLGKYVKKPALSEKLLRKPPFRFLHDVINVIIKETGFLKGLFSETELVSDNVKDKDAKIAFLAKLIEAVKTISKTDLKVKPSKIVAGLEPKETNVLLQTIARAIDKKLDGSEYIKQLKSGLINTSNENKKSKKTSNTVKTSKEHLKTDKAASKASKNDSQKKKSPNETPKSTDRSKSKVKSKEENSKGRRDSKSKNKSETKEKRETLEDEDHTNETHELIDEVLNDGNNDKINEDANNNQNNDTEKKTDENVLPNTENIPSDVRNSAPENYKDTEPLEHEQIENVAARLTSITDNDNKSKENNNKSKEDIREGLKIERRPSASLVRPKSARPKSGEIKEKPILQPPPRENKEQPTLQVFQSEDIPNYENQKAGPVRPGSSLRPPSVRPSSARPGAPRLRPDSAIPMDEVVTMGKINVIVESVDKDADEEETVVIQNSPDLVENHEVIDIPLENKGHLVEQILETINESTTDGHRPKIEIDWERDAFRGKDAAAKEIKDLRSLIQTLTRTANPLGKLLNYLHEDVEAMHNELEMWTNTKRQLLMEIAKQKRISEEANEPLLNQLETLKQDIKKQEHEILVIRSNILRNEIRIKELLTK